MWEFIRDSALLWVGLFLLGGLVMLLVGHTLLGLVAVLVLAIIGYVIYRVSQVPTSDQLEKLRERYEGKSMETVLREHYRKTWVQLALGIVVFVVLAAMWLIYARHNQPME